VPLLVATKTLCNVLKHLNKVNSDSSTAESKGTDFRNPIWLLMESVVNIESARLVSFCILRFVQDVRIQLLLRNNICILSHPWRQPLWLSTAVILCHISPYKHLPQSKRRSTPQNTGRMYAYITFHCLRHYGGKWKRAKASHTTEEHCLHEVQKRVKYEYTI
jgi:hypothetical protein